MSSVRFVRNGRCARRRFFRAFGALRRTNGRVILTTSHPPRRVIHLRRHLVSQFSVKLVTSVRPPSFRAHITVLRGGTRCRRMRLPQRTVRCVTSDCASGVHRLRKTLVQTVTCASVSKLPVAIRRLATILGPPASGLRTSPGTILTTITRRFRIAMSRLGKTSQQHRVDRTQRVKVCLVHRRASLDLPGVNSRFNKGSRAAILCDYAGIRGRLGQSLSLTRAIHRVDSHVAVTKHN